MAMDRIFFICVSFLLIGCFSNFVISTHAMTKIRSSQSSSYSEGDEDFIDYTLYWRDLGISEPEFEDEKVKEFFIKRRNFTREEMESIYTFYPALARNLIESRGDDVTTTTTTTTTEKLDSIKRRFRFLPPSDEMDETEFPLDVIISELEMGPMDRLRLFEMFPLQNSRKLLIHLAALVARHLHPSDFDFSGEDHQLLLMRLFRIYIFYLPDSFWEEKDVILLEEKLKIILYNRIWMMDLVDVLIEHENLKSLNILYSFSSHYVLSIVLPRLAACGSVELTKSFVTQLLDREAQVGNTYIRSVRILASAFYELSLRRILHPSQSSVCDEIYKILISLIPIDNSQVKDSSAANDTDNGSQEEAEELSYLKDMYRIAKAIVEPVIAEHIADRNVLISRPRITSEVRVSMEKRGLSTISSVVSSEIYDYDLLKIHDKFLHANDEISGSSLAKSRSIESSIFSKMFWPLSDSFIKFMLLYGLGLVTYRSFDDKVKLLDFRRPFSTKFTYLLVLPLLNSIVLRDDNEMLVKLVDRISRANLASAKNDLLKSIFVNAIQYSASSIISEHKNFFDLNQTHWKATIDACVVSSSVPIMYNNLVGEQQSQEIDIELGHGEDESGLF